MSRPRPQYPACQCSSHGPEIDRCSRLISIGLGDVPQNKITPQMVRMASEARERLEAMGLGKSIHKIKDPAEATSVSAMVSSAMMSTGRAIHCHLAQAAGA